MNGMNISLPDTLKDFVDEQVARRSYGPSSAYVCELIRKDQDRQRLHRLVLDSANSAPSKPFDEGRFDTLRARARRVR